MKLGIIGLPNVGKTTLFNSLTGQNADTSNYPFTTVSPNIGTANVPDKRLSILSDIHASKKITYAAVEFVDIAGLVKDAGKGAGLGGKFLSGLRDCNAIVHVVRCFVDPQISHVSDELNPASDIETINIELLFSDIDIIDRRIQRSEKRTAGDKKLAYEVETLNYIKERLLEGVPARLIDISDRNAIPDLDLLTAKPVIYAANIDESLKSPFAETVSVLAENEGAACFAVSAKIEEELSKLSIDEQDEFLQELGLTERGLDRLIRESYDLLGLISYFTAGPKESRAWTIKKGQSAVKAAEKIHSDIARGFIKAEVIHYDTLVKHGSPTAAKTAGDIRLEGKEYIVGDGDVILFRFNV